MTRMSYKLSSVAQSVSGSSVKTLALVVVSYVGIAKRNELHRYDDCIYLHSVYTSGILCMWKVKKKGGQQ